MKLLAVVALLCAIEACYMAVTFVLGLVPAGPPHDLASVVLPFAAAVLPLLALERLAPSGARQIHNYRRGAAYALAYAASVLLWAKVSAHITAQEYPLFKWRLDRHTATPMIAGAIILNMWISDFFHYWFHRACHKYRWLWQFHGPHHAVQEFNCMALYGHLLAPAVQIPLLTVPFTFFFGIETPHEIALLSSFALAWAYFIHADTWVNFGHLGVIFCDNAHHKMHHSREHMNVNFATTFPIWDVVFGTYCKPEPAETLSVGVAGTPAPRLLDLVRL
jgi:sterol desaturase/sphingolipid hydroxylase (fatty acid hydroxylase superfamily)